MEKKTKKGLKGILGRYLFTFMFISSWAVLGVALALSVATVKLGGDITFIATDVQATITHAQSKNAMVNITDDQCKELKFDASTSGPSENIATWSGLKLQFQSSADDVVLTFKVQNKNLEDKAMRVDFVDENMSGITAKNFKNAVMKVEAVNSSNVTSIVYSNYSDANSSSFVTSYVVNAQDELTVNVTFHVVDSNTGASISGYEIPVKLNADSSSTGVADVNFGTLTVQTPTAEVQSIVSSQYYGNTTNQEVSLKGVIEGDNTAYNLLKVEMKVVSYSDNAIIKYFTYKDNAFVLADTDNDGEANNNAFKLNQFVNFETKLKLDDYFDDYKGKPCTYKLTVLSVAGDDAQSATETILNSEYQLINNASQLFALRGALMDSTALSYAGYSNTADLASFTYPSSVTTNEEKVAYLQNRRYVLGKDLEITFRFEKGSSLFFGIGTNGTPFKGYFDGNGHKIILKSALSSGFVSNFAPYFGLFGCVDNGIICNLNVDVANSLIVTGKSDRLYFGAIAGEFRNKSFINNCQVNILSNVSFGVSYTHDTYRPDTKMGGMIGECLYSTCKNSSVNMASGSKILGRHETAFSGDLTRIYTGGVIGDVSSSSVTERNALDYLSLNMDNAQIIVGGKDYVYGGGIVGHGRYVDGRHLTTVMKDSQITGQNVSYRQLTGYALLSLGGIMGFAEPGSDNTNNIGAVGVSLNNCSLTIQNSSLMDSIKGTLDAGSGVNVGGLVGCAFNNCQIFNSTVDIRNANLIAERTAENSTSAAFGGHVGGIIGRLEHTGEIKNCSVNGNNLHLIVNSNDIKNYAGGIVGNSIGAWQRNIISVANCTFEGNGTSEIVMNLTKTNLDTKYCGIGALAGGMGYTTANNSVSNVAVKLNISNSSLKTSDICGIAKLIGIQDYNNIWTEGKYFTDINNLCSYNNSYSNVTTSTNSSAVNSGDVYGYKYNRAV